MASLQPRALQRKLSIDHTNANRTNSVGVGDLLQTRQGSEGDKRKSATKR